MIKIADEKAFAVIATSIASLMIGIFPFYLNKFTIYSKIMTFLLWLSDKY